MNDLWLAIGLLATDLHRDRIDSVAEALAGLKSLDEFDWVRSAFGPNVDKERINALQSAWASIPEISPQEIRAALLAAAQTAEIVSSDESVELVWTGPKTGLIPTRNTEQVILEVIGYAKSHLFLVSYVFYNASTIIDALNNAIARGIQVDVLLESSTQHGGTVSGDSVQQISSMVPNSTIYIWKSDAKASTSNRYSASVHAKCAVADGELAFVTSANLTSAALERNMELGVLLRGGTAPMRLRSHLMALVTTKEISECGL